MVEQKGACKWSVLLLCRLSGRDMTAHYHDDSRDGLARGTVVYRQCIYVFLFCSGMTGRWGHMSYKVFKMYGFSPHSVSNCSVPEI